MSLTDHIAILTHSNLVTARPNKNNGKLEFYALLAFPPAAMADLATMYSEKANGAPLGNFDLSCTPNSKMKKPIPGVPDDYLVVRAASAYAPFLADAQATQLDQRNPINALAINQTFYAGKRVRAELSAWTWVSKAGKPGMSVNLSGLMDAGAESTRLNIGSSVGAAFSQHAQTGAAPAAASNPFTKTAETKVAELTPAEPQQTGGEQASNPFVQQAAKPNGANPFV